jgi:abhydrolase domain-containing protein 17
MMFRSLELTSRSSVARRSAKWNAGVANVLRRRKEMPIECYSKVEVDNAKLKLLLIGDLSLKRVIRSIILVPFLVYIVAFLYAYFFADKIIFQPPPSSYRDTNEIIKLSSGDAKISAVYFRNPAAAYTILYSHGNAEDIGSLRPVLEEIQRMGFSVFAYDYRGYGTSSGAPSEAGVYQDIDAAYDYLIRDLKIPGDRIIALGRSLGGGVAIDLAQRKPLAGLIVESSFVTAFRVLTRFSLFPADRFTSISKIRKVRCPILVIHGRSDEVIPFWHGEKLFQQANEPKLSYWVDGAGHNNLFDVAGSGYAQTLKRFVELIDKNKEGLRFLGKQLMSSSRSIRRWDISVLLTLK